MIGLLFLCFLGLISIPVIRYQISKRKLSHLPDFNPKCGSWFPVLTSMGADGYKISIESVVDDKKGGFLPIARWGLAPNGRCAVVVTDPDGIRDVLTNTDLFEKDVLYKGVAELLGENIVTEVSSGNQWKLQRRLMTPVFHFAPLKKMIPKFVEQGEHFVKTLTASNGKDIDVCRTMNEITLAVIITAGFGSEFDVAHMAERWHAINADLLPLVMGTIFLGSWFHRIPFPFATRFHQAVQDIKTLCLDAIKKRRREGLLEGNDLLSLMLEAQKDIPEVTDEVILGDCIMFLLAGQDTTASTLDWCTYFLGRNPDIQKKLYAEIDEVLGTDLPTEATLSKLTYTKQVIEETLRIRAPVSLLSKVAKRDTTLLGHEIPAGTAVTVALGINGHDETKWKNPGIFDPERFSENSPNYHPYAYIPFSAGSRNCIGQKFAMQEALVLLSMLVQNFEIEVDADAKFTVNFTATCMPIGLKARFVPRNKTK